MRLQQIFIFFVACCLQTSILWGQDSSIIGVVTDENNIPIPFANVVLKDTASKIISGTITEDSGAFIFDSLEDGSYKLNVSFIGYQDYESNVITLSRKLQLPTIQLLENTESLDEVTLTAKRPVITRESDRLVFNVENSILSSGSTWDIINTTPGVIVRQDELTVRNQRVAVYLNDQRVQLDAAELQSLLEGMGGEAVKAVEVIMNPPARYESEGGPILNIVSSKAKFEGYKGSVNARGTYGIFPKHYFGMSHFWKTKKVNLFFNYGYNPLKKTKQNDNFINYFLPSGTASWNQDFELKQWTQAHSANLILDYAISERQTLGITAIGLLSPNETALGRSLTDIDQDIDPFSIRTISGVDSEKSNIALDINYDYALENANFSTNVHYTNYNRDVNQRLTSAYRDDDQSLFRTVRFNSQALQDIEIYTAQLDFSSMLGKVSFETGVKYATIDSRSKIDFSNVQNEGNNGLSLAENDDFLYDENVFAGYLSFAREWKKWSIKTGLRAEQTDSKGNSLILNETVDLSYLEWFPSAYIQFKASTNHVFSIDYGRKLERPRYQDLNPFSYFINENNVITGNSGLLPSFSHNFNLNYAIQEKYFFDVYYRDNGENILILPLQDNVNQVLRTERQNAVASKSWGIDFTHAKSIAKWWYFYTYLSAFHEEETFVARESNDEIVTNAVEGVFVSGYNFFTLDKEKGWKAEASIEYLSKFLSASYVVDGTTNVSLGISKSFWNDRAQLTIKGNDLLGEANALARSQYLNQDNAYLAIPETQNLQIGFKYNFGNFKLEDNKRSIDKKELERLEITN